MTKHSNDWGLRFPRHAEQDLVVGKKIIHDMEPIWAHVETVDRVGDGEERHILISCDNRLGMEWLLGSEENVKGFDVIYADPPYNTGASNWRYQNRIRAKGDGYSSALWLSQMERRIRLAKKLLRDDGALICAIDENELAHLLILLRDIMGPERETHIITIQHNPRGIQGRNFSVTNEFALFSVPKNMSIISPRSREKTLVQPLKKWGALSKRKDAPNCAYPIRMDAQGRFSSAGHPIPLNESFPFLNQRRFDDGSIEFLPTRADGTEGRWRYSRKGLERIKDNLRIEKDERGHPKLVLLTEEKKETTVWTGSEYAAFIHGSRLVKTLTGEDFPFPKSLWTVKDCIGTVLHNRPNGRVLDPWGGSGTTAHAVMCLNAEDGGYRSSVTLCKNEVNGREAKSLKKQGFADGSPEWETRGLVQSVTWPRIKACITGLNVRGTPVKFPPNTGPFKKETAVYQKLDFQLQPHHPKARMVNFPQTPFGLPKS